MNEKSDEKLSALLDRLFSLHEADYIYNLIFDDDKDVDDVLKFVDYIHKCEREDIDTNIDDYENGL